MYSCSTCYECESDVVLEDAQGNPQDTISDVDEFCTADKEEIQSREEAGAVCRVQ